MVLVLVFANAQMCYLFIFGEVKVIMMQSFDFESLKGEESFLSAASLDSVREKSAKILRNRIIVLTSKTTGYAAVILSYQYSTLISIFVKPKCQIVFLW